MSCVRQWAGVSGGGVASELGLTNIQDPCVIPMKKFGLCASDAGGGELGSRMTWAVSTLERLWERMLAWDHQRLGSLLQASLHGS